MTKSQSKGFYILDYGIFLFVVIASIGIGIYHGIYRKTDTTGSYLMADRKLQIIPTTLSMLISFLSAISILGNAAETYFYGVNYFFYVISYAIGSTAAAYLFVPLFYPLKLTSINEYLLLRYRSKGVVYLAVILQLLTYSVLGGTVLLGSAIMVQSMVGVDVWVTVLGLAFLATTYTAIGGFKAVIWSDVFQSVVIFLGLIVILCTGTMKVGGITEIWSSLAEYERLQLELSPLSRSSATGFSLGLTFQCMLTYGTTQMAVQRYCALPSIHAAKQSMLLTMPINMIIQSLTGLTGVVVFAYFIKTGCDPYSAGAIHGKNQILPYFIMEVLNYPAIPGTFIACVVCGSLSNLSSLYNSSTAIVWQDLLRNRFGDCTEQRRALVIKILSFVFGIWSIGTALMCSNLGGTLKQLTFSLMSIFSAPAASLFVSGALSTRPNAKCAALGALLSLAFTAWLAIGNVLSEIVSPIKPTVITNCSSDVVTSEIVNTFNESVAVLYNSTTLQGTGKNIAIFYRIPFFWHLALGTTVGVTSSFLLSLIPGLKENHADVSPHAMFPFLRPSLEKNKSEKSNGEFGTIDVIQGMLTETDLCIGVTENEEDKELLQMNPFKGVATRVLK